MRVRAAVAVAEVGTRYTRFAARPEGDPTRVLLLQATGNVGSAGPRSCPDIGSSIRSI